MDDAVLAAIARWPNVPNVYGWLALDRRGKWRLQGSVISNPNVTDFMSRNYESDERGAWFFQNGPQRVYLQLEYTPWVLRIGDQQALVKHDGEAVADVREVLLDENGNLLIAFAQSVGLVDDHDLPALLEVIVDAQGKNADETSLTRLMNGEQQALSLRWHGRQIPLSAIRSNDVAPRYHFVRDPQPDSNTTAAD